MNEAIIAALITAAGAIGAQWVLARRNTKDLYAKLDKQSELADERLNAKLEKHQAVTDTKLEALTAEVRKHNNFAMEIPSIKTEIKNLYYRLNEKEAQK